MSTLSKVTNTGGFHVNHRPCPQNDTEIKRGKNGHIISVVDNRKKEDQKEDTTVVVQDYGTLTDGTIPL